MQSIMTFMRKFQKPSYLNKYITLNFIIKSIQFRSTVYFHWYLIKQIQDGLEYLLFNSYIVVHLFLSVRFRGKYYMRIPNILLMFNKKSIWKHRRSACNIFIKRNFVTWHNKILWSRYRHCMHFLWRGSFVTFYFIIFFTFMTCNCPY